ncbi:MAG: indole-3-glycerol-phosphate synthase TrpC, partial [Chryseobacterium sp.]|nr:indole-3-glycerol-phosphate synthase TrpC [Chryseobacterium sp.]
MTILDTIIKRKREEIAISKAEISIENLKNSEFFGRKSFSLKESLKNKSGIIAEFKRQSPSKGIINDRVQPLEEASAYENFGASGISILTDRDFFGGSFDDILNVRKHINIPILRKDFMVDEYQFYEAKS